MYACESMDIVTQVGFNANYLHVHGMLYGLLRELTSLPIIDMQIETRATHTYNLWPVTELTNKDYTSHVAELLLVFAIANMCMLLVHHKNRQNASYEMFQDAHFPMDLNSSFMKCCLKSTLNVNQFTIFEEIIHTFMWDACFIHAMVSNNVFLTYQECWA